MHTGMEAWEPKSGGQPGANSATYWHQERRKQSGHGSLSSMAVLKAGDPLLASERKCTGGRGRGGGGGPGVGE